MSGGDSQPSLRKYLGAIKDSTTVGLAKVNSDYKELDIAIVRATNHVERPAKEKHLTAIFLAISATRPRADVAYCIHALARRLSKTHNWAVALKTLIVIHRALREVDPTFREELLNYGRRRGHMLNLSHFRDDSSPNAWDYSAWVRSYALFLEERLECFRTLKYDVETDPPRTRDLDTPELLEHLQALQQLFHRLLGCQPQGAAGYNIVIQLPLSMVARESIKIYNAINDGTVNMVDKFFEMQRHDALKALDIYRRAGQQAELLSEFYEVCKTFDIGRGEKFIKIEQPPASFLTAMEDYIRDAPRASVHKDKVADGKILLAIEYKSASEVEEAAPPPPATTPPPPPPPEPVKEEAPAPKQIDLLDLNDSTITDTSDLDNKNALALAIVPIDNLSTTTPSRGLANENTGTTGWELALVTAPSSNETAVASSKLAGGLDKLTLDSLYDDANRRANQNVSYNPWEVGPMASPMMQPMAHDPFYASNAIAAPHSVQMAAMAQQQQAFMLQQQMMMMGQQPHQAPLNPFAANPYAAVGTHPYGSGMPFQSSNTYTGYM
ncbi:ENTH/VHS domain-containing protein [Dioscorea alata]|uniref:ENTH/VHS domain-containing protein n=1 Tax=Dioscorea alata TaxID=55571 RepID=A0ACB7VLD0_DIOAL|nr:ENTH/VHS domain-containing protein [Dioscorea alata]